MKAYTPSSQKKWRQPVKGSMAFCLGILLFFGSGLPSAGQCGNTLGVRSYDTLLTGPGYGVYAVSFPKWNPDSGTLVSVTLTALVSQQYSFTLKNATRKDGLTWVLALPKDKDSGFDRVLLGFKEEQLRKMEMYDSFNHITLITFSEVERNPTLQDSTFLFTAPKGADVVGE